MARTRRSRKGAKQQQTILIILLVIFLFILGLYLFTGSDPLGLFPEEPTPTSDLVFPIPTAGGPESLAAGGWWEVYFADPANHGDPDQPAGSIQEAFIKYINAAEESIHIAAFEFDITPIANALIAAKQRGVDVRWVTDDEHGIEADKDEGHGQFAMLEKAKIEVRDDGRSALMHNKFVIFDGEIVWTGATNLTKNGIFKNNNNVIVIRSPELAEIYEREFEEMWAGEFGPRSPSTTADQTLNIQGTPVFALFAAEDDVIEKLAPIVNSARRSIYFMAFSFTHDTLGEAMLARANRGVKVSGIFETRGSETESSEMPRLFCAGLPIRQDGNPSTYHHKVIVVDEQIVITGSLNFSENADTGNDENVLVITNPDIARLYLEEFERNWAEARVPEDISCP